MSVPDEFHNDEINALLRAERDAPGPSPEVAARVWRGVQDGIAAGAAAGAGAGAVKAVGAPSAAGKSAGTLWVKWLAVSAVVVAGGVAVVAPQIGGGDSEATRAVTSAPVAEAAPPAPKPLPPAVIPVVQQHPAAALRAGVHASEKAENMGSQTDPELAVDEVVASASGAVREPEAQPAKRASLRARRAAPAKQAPTAPAPTSPEPAPTAVAAKAPASAGPTPASDALSKELALLAEARKALIAGDSAAALVAVRRHGEVYPRGQLAEERDALHVQALAASGQKTAAEGLARRFEARYPGSMLLRAVRAAIGQ